MVAVTHPDLFAVVCEPAVEQGGFIGGGRDEGAAEFGGTVATFDLAAEAMHHDLLAVADAKQGHAECEQRLRGHWRAVGEDGSGPTGQDHRFGGEFRKERVGDFVERVDFAVDVQLSQASCDKLGDLAAEVDDEKAIMLGHGAGE